jgi:stage II sporulation protein D
MRGRLLVLAVALAWSLDLRGAAAEVGPIRVALGEDLRAVEVGAADLVSVLEPGVRRPMFGVPGPRVVRVVPWAAGLEVDTRRVALASVRLETRRGPLRVGTRDYAGALELRRTGPGILLVNELPLEEYVAGVVRAEVSEKWPVEALRAMAVVTRSYAAFQQARNAARPFHVVASSQDQNFAGWVPEGAPSRLAARDTTGQVLIWENRVVLTFHHSDSGGFTEPPQTVFSGEGVPPLPGVRDEFSLDSPHYAWMITVPLATIGERLRQGGLDVGEVRGLTVLERSASLRVVRLTVEHARGGATVKGTEFRRLLGYDILRSTLFVPSPVAGAIRFEGRGWGHGVGLSQFGARGMAERGYTYRQILQHYFPGTTLGLVR